jgi:hypothetical protein
MAASVFVGISIDGFIALAFAAFLPAAVPAQRAATMDAIRALRTE